MIALLLNELHPEENNFKLAILVFYVLTDGNEKSIKGFQFKR